jgi:hypothetical protein
MFWIFKVTADWIWLLVPLLGCAVFVSSWFFKPYASILKPLGAAIVVVGFYVLGMLYSDNAWKQAAKDLQAQVQVAEAKSATVTEVVKNTITTKTQIIKERGKDVVTYVDREVVKYDNSCVIPKEFVTAHNRAAEPQK